MDEGRTNLFYQIGIPTARSLLVLKLYPIQLKYQNSIDEEIRLLGNVGCISKSLSP